MKTPTLNKIIQETKISLNADNSKKSIGIDTVVTILVFQGLKMILPQIKMWIGTGIKKIELKRLEIEKKLKKYALEMELDYQEAVKAANKITKQITAKNIQNIVDELEQNQ